MTFFLTNWFGVHMCIYLYIPLSLYVSKHKLFNLYNVTFLTYIFKSDHLALDKQLVCS